MIFDDDGTPRISVGDVETPENDADGTIDFPVTLSHVTTTPVTVRYTTFDGTATQPVDYIATSATLTIPAGATSATISVTIIDDNLTEGETRAVPYCEPGFTPPACYDLFGNHGGETILLRLDTPNGAILEATEAIGTISDDESLPFVSAFPWDAFANENAGEIVFWPTLSHPSIHEVSARYRTDALVNAGEQLNLADPCSATSKPCTLTALLNAGEQLNLADPVDGLDPTVGRVVFPPGAITAPIQIPIYDNDYQASVVYACANATFRLNLDQGVNAIAGLTASGVVWDDEYPPYLTAIRGPGVLESATRAIFTLTLNRFSDQDTIVSYQTAPSYSTATAGVDYTPQTEP